MVNKAIALLSLFILMASYARCQHTQTVELQPIQAVGTKYYYDFKRVNSGYALQIPLQSLHDEEINARYRNYVLLRKIGRYANLVPLIYFAGLVLNSNNNTITQAQAETFTYLFLGSLAVNIGMNAASNPQLKSAIDRYNFLIIGKKSLSIQLEKTPSNQSLVGIGFHQRF
jgi:hypothetical protein